MSDTREYAAEIDKLREEYGHGLVNLALAVYREIGIGSPHVSDLRALLSLLLKQWAANELARRAMAEAAR
jgi:hypothetical protein